MKLSAIGGTIVGVATGLGAILTVVEQWHNIEQWSKPPPIATPSAAVLLAAPPVAAPPQAMAPSAAVAPSMAPAEAGLSGCYSGSLGSALIPFAQCGNAGSITWGVNKIRICFKGQSSDGVTALFQEDRNFLAQNGLTVVREHTGTQVNALSGAAADINVSYSRTDTNLYGMQVPVFVESRLHCRADSGDLECRVQPVRMDYAGMACTVVSGEQEASLEGE